MHNKKIRSTAEMLSTCLMLFVAELVDAENPQHNAELAQSLIERADYCELITDDQPRVRIGLTISDILTTMEQKDDGVLVSCADGPVEVSSFIPTFSSEEGVALIVILFNVEKILREQSSSCDC